MSDALPPGGDLALVERLRDELAMSTVIAALLPLPADIDRACELAEGICADPDKRAKVRVRLVEMGMPKLADMIDEAVQVSRALLRVCGKDTAIDATNSAGTP